MQRDHLRQLFRHLQAFESAFEAYSVEVIEDPSGYEWSVHDLRYLYECRSMLSRRQAQAIELCLFENMKEREAAKVMGISEKSPVAIYANKGLDRLIELARTGALPRFRPEPPTARPQSILPKALVAA